MPVVEYDEENKQIASKQTSNTSLWGIGMLVEQIGEKILNSITFVRFLKKSMNLYNACSPLLTHDRFAADALPCFRRRASERQGTRGGRRSKEVREDSCW